MRKFNLKEARLGKPVCTRNGDKARIICTDLIGQESLIIVAVYEPKSKIECVIPYTRKGEYSVGDVSEFDLFMVEDEEPKRPFKPFDKVLVRDTDMSKWDCEFFNRYAPDEEDRFPFNCLNAVYLQCIPYNEETAHLVGTTDAPPEKYVIW